MRRRRRRRGLAARQLVSLAFAGALAEPGRWDWDTLGSLPPWCLLDEPARRRLQRVAALLFIGPELRLWIDRARLDAAAALVGADALAAAIEVADRRFASGADDPAPVAGATPAFAAPGAGAVDADAAEVAVALAARLDGIGAAVLLATLPDALPIEGLPALLGEPAGALAAAVADPVLDEAERLLEAFATPAVPAAPAVSTVAAVAP